MAAIPGESKTAPSCDGVGDGGSFGIGTLLFAADSTAGGRRGNVGSPAIHPPRTDPSQRQGPEQPAGRDGQLRARLLSATTTSLRRRTPVTDTPSTNFFQDNDDIRFQMSRVDWDKLVSRFLSDTRNSAIGS